MTRRGKWSTKWSFLTTCVGYATGLGNLWRFPALAYENGGGAFLVPYMIASLTIGFPMLYLELSIGQFARVGPARCFRYFMPAAQGLGWAGIFISFIVGIYYNLINVYSAVYLYKIFGWTFGRDDWMHCNNHWNTGNCQSSKDNDWCTSQSNGTLNFYFNGTCHNDAFQVHRQDQVKQGVVATPLGSVEEFFENYVHEKGSGFDDIFAWNYKMLGGFAVIWAITAVTLIKGVNWIGKISLVSATSPYIIITALFARAVTLDGADIGLQFFIYNPDWSYLLKFQAFIQICYTLAIGFGGLLSLSSYNDEHHNCFRDALIVVGFDTFMSIFGGTAAFCVMGFLAKQANLPLDQVIQSGTTLTFVAYPEAMSRMPYPGLWLLLFFLMFFLLGVSSQFGMTESMCSGLADQFPSLHKHKGKVAVLVCTVSFILGLPLCTKGGIFWFTLMNEYAGTFALFAIALGEVLLISYYYGTSEYAKDLRWMFGPQRHAFGRLFGPSGSLVIFNWRIIAPTLLTFLFGFSLYQYFDYTVTYGKGTRVYHYPSYASTIGWTLAVFPLLAIPLFAIYNMVITNSRKGSWTEAFMVQPKLRSFPRLRGSEKALSAMVTEQPGRIVPYNPRY